MVFRPLQQKNADINEQVKNHLVPLLVRETVVFTSFSLLHLFLTATDSGPKHHSDGF